MNMRFRSLLGVGVVSCLAAGARTAPHQEEPSVATSAQEGDESRDRVPKWVRKVGAWYDTDEGGKFSIYAVGMADAGNQRVQKMRARANARMEIARGVGTHVESISVEYERQVVGVLDDGTEEFVEIFKKVNRQVTEATLVGVQQVESFQDPQQKTYYVLYKLPLAAVVKEYKQDATARVREALSSASPESKKRMLKALDQGIEEVGKRVSSMVEKENGQEKDSDQAPALKGFTSLGKNTKTGFYEYRNKETGLEFVLVPKVVMEKLGPEANEKSKR